MSRLLHDLVSVTAERSPDADAFRYQGSSLTYSELDQMSARLASVLVEHGIRRGDRVGVYLQSGLRMPVAVFGILKAGAAFVPLDPSAPANRTASVVGQCDLTVVVTDDALMANFSKIDPEGLGVRVIIGTGSCAYAVPWDQVETAPAAPPVQLVEDDLAYIMLTSGSTGTPKGIVHTHRSGLAYASDALALYDIGSGDRIVNHSSLHFDMSLLGFFGGPMAGASVILLPEVFKRLPAELASYTEQEQATIWYSVPTALVQMLLYGGLDHRDLSALRWVISAGEPFPPKHLRSLMNLLPTARFSNAYGPAEVNVCTYFHIDEPPTSDTDAVPIGLPCPSTETMILDESDEPVSTGQPGELVVRSATAMRGYWNAPDLTARAFYKRKVCPGVEDLFYRTGDRVIDRGDGVMLFLGRKDRQVKIRGYRIELEEVEAVLSQHPQVAEAGAFESSDLTSIHAAATLTPAANVEPEALISFCRAQLPKFAVPSSIHIISEMPRTGTDKIDRNALRANLAGDCSEIEQERV